MNSSDDEEQIHGKSRGNKNIAQEIRSGHVNVLLPKESKSKNQLLVMLRRKNWKGKYLQQDK